MERTEPGPSSVNALLQLRQYYPPMRPTCTLFPLLLLGAVLAPAQTVSAEELQFFETEIQPILAGNCQVCHNENLRSSGLALTARRDPPRRQPRPRGRSRRRRQQLAAQSRKANRRPENAPHGQASPTKKSPPSSSGSHAACPGRPPRKAPPQRRPICGRCTRSRKPSRPRFKTPPGSATRSTASCWRVWKTKAFEPSPEADRATLIRRVSLDLIGLPPTPAEVEQFVNDKSPDAYERLVDRLLASAHYGERWGRHWLDVARYADSDGYTIDGKRDMWKYRDWVISALNRDMPFDQFAIEQLAGDLLPNPTTDQIVATGFQPQHAAQPGRRHRLRAVSRRGRRRPRQHHRRGVPGPHARLRALPRSQVRPAFRSASSIRSMPSSTTSTSWPNRGARKGATTRRTRSSNSASPEELATPRRHQGADRDCSKRELDALQRKAARQAGRVGSGADQGADRRDARGSPRHFRPAARQAQRHPDRGGRARSTSTATWVTANARPASTRCASGCPT